MARNNQYNEKELIRAIQVRRPYQQHCVNYNGTFEGKPYIEILSEFLLGKPDFDFKTYQARKSFVLHREEEVYMPNIASEKGLCRYWFKGGFDDERLVEEFGKPVEFELNFVPGTKTNIDLVTYKESTNEVYLIEVKGRIPKDKRRYESAETLLRCGLEIKTYFDSFGEKGFATLRRQLEEAGKIPQGCQCAFRMGVIVPLRNKAAKQYQNNKDFEATNKLLSPSHWDIKVVAFENGPRTAD